MNNWYSFLCAAAWLLPGAVAAQRSAVPATPLSAMQPGRVYVGICLGPPTYWRERIFRQPPLQAGAHRLATGLTVFAGRQLSPHWAAQVGFNAYFLPTASAEAQGYYQNYATVAPVFITSSATFGATAVAVPLLVRYNPRLHLGLDSGVEGWLGLTPVWQRLQLDGEQREDGQLTHEEHFHTQAADLYATGGLSLVAGAGPGLEVLLDLGLARRLRLAGTAPPAPGWVPLGGLSVRYQLGGRPRRTRY